jgi:hypothetical protein
VEEEGRLEHTLKRKKILWTAKNSFENIINQALVKVPSRQHYKFSRSDLIVISLPLFPRGFNKKTLL